MRRPFILQENRAYFQTEVFKGYTQKIAFRQRDFRPLFPFEYYVNTGEDTITRNKNFATSEILLEARLTRNETFIQNDNERISLGTGNWPILTLRYIMGVKSLGGDFSYHKFALSFAQSVNLGYVGTSSYNLSLGYIPSRVPYHLLQVHLGNESVYYNALSFNLMKYFEFVSDSYASLSYTHRFEGLFFNRLPLIKKLKWRLLATGNFLYGTVRDENLKILPATDLSGQPIEQFGFLNKHIPYVELGYGIENIFKFIRVDAIHRINYLDKPDVKRFGVKVSAQFRL
jgi:hypothetical protein